VPVAGDLLIPDSMVHDGNTELVLEENKVLRWKRLDCLKVTTAWLNSLGVSYFLSDGTLLGAARDGKMIDIDIDTDVSIMVFDFEKALLGAASLPDGYALDCVNGEIDWSLCQGPPPYVCADKSLVGWKQLCVVDVRDYSNIIKETMRPETDIYTYYVDPLGFLRSNYATDTQLVHMRKFRYYDVFPLSTLTFEGDVYSAPNNPRAYLKELYGYIGRNAYWDPVLKKYRRKPGSEIDPFDPDGE